MLKASKKQHDDMAKECKICFIAEAKDGRPFCLPCSRKIDRINAVQWWLRRQSFELVDRVWDGFLIAVGFYLFGLLFGKL